MTLPDSNNAISSLESEGGHSRYAAPDGLTPEQRGRHHAHANLSARQARGLGLLTSGTYGPPHIGLSASAALSWCLASNLAALTQTTGSTLYRLTWKPWAMPSGRVRFRLRASVPRTRETVLIGWPTPIASNGRGAGNFAREGGLNLQTAALLAAWPTPTATDGRGGYSGGASTQRKTFHRQVGCDRSACWLADANDQQRPFTMSARSAAHISRQWNQNSEEAAGRGGVVRPGPANGFWRDADWLFSRDGFWRPVSAGSFPLADGIPGRVGRLRAYGNAINIEAAAQFIRAYMARVGYV